MTYNHWEQPPGKRYRAWVEHKAQQSYVKPHALRREQAWLDEMRQGRVAWLILALTCPLWTAALWMFAFR